LIRRWLRGRHVASSRSGTFAQAVLLALKKTRLWQGAFAPRELPRFHATMPPSDSPPSLTKVMNSRCELSSPHALRSGLPAGPLRFLDGSVDARRPLSPRRVRPPHSLVASRPMSGFARFGRLTTLMERFHEAELGSLTLRLTSSLPRVPATGSPPPPPSQLHGERAIAMVSSFQLTRPIRLDLTHRNEANEARLLGNTASFQV
jgi:hypothetical protein